MLCALERRLTELERLADRRQPEPVDYLDSAQVLAAWAELSGAATQPRRLEPDVEQMSDHEAVEPWRRLAGPWERS